MNLKFQNRATDHDFFMSKVFGGPNAVLQQRYKTMIAKKIFIFAPIPSSLHKLGVGAPCNVFYGKNFYIYIFSIDTWPCIWVGGKG